MIRIEMPDGSVVGATKETPNMETKKPEPAPLVYKETAMPNGEVMQSWNNPPARTRLQIATDLDAAEREVTAAQLAVAAASQKVRDLSRELKGFGVKKRAPKGTP